LEVRLDDGLHELEELSSGFGGEDEVNVASIAAVETEVKLTPLRTDWVVFPTGAMKFREVLDGDHELEPHVFAFPRRVRRISRISAIGGSALGRSLR
jgi:hypothetical protein